MAIARGCREMRRRRHLQAPLQGPGQQAIKRGRKVMRGNLGKCRLAHEERGKPLRSGFGERSIAEVRPFALPCRTQEANAVTQLLASPAPGQTVEPELGDSFGQ